MKPLPHDVSCDVVFVSATKFATDNAYCARGDSATAGTFQRDTPVPIMNLFDSIDWP